MDNTQEQQEQLYPVDNNQSDKFIAGIVKEIHSTDFYTKSMQDTRAPNQVRMGALAAKVVINTIQRVKEQAQLRINQNVIPIAIQLSVMEMATIGKALGQKVTKDDVIKAGQIAGDNIQGVIGKKQEQTQQPQQQPQGQGQGVLSQSLQGGGQ